VHRSGQGHRLRLQESCSGSCRDFCGRDRGRWRLCRTPASAILPVCRRHHKWSRAAPKATGGRPHWSTEPA